MTDEELLEENWGRALVNKSGHALMALLESIRCRGICYDKTARKFCAITDRPPESEYSKKHYLFLTTSSAAESLVYGNQDEGGANSDRLAFNRVRRPVPWGHAQRSSGPIAQQQRQAGKTGCKAEGKMSASRFEFGNLARGRDGRQ